MLACLFAYLFRRLFNVCFVDCFFFSLKWRNAQVFSGSLFTNHSQEHSLFFFSKICKLECNTTSDWLNRMV